MKKYKLIKTYPGSPKLGTIVDNYSPHSLYVQCIDEPEYWKEIKEELPIGTKIIQVRNTESIKETCYEKTKEGWYFGDLKVWIDESEIGEGKRFQIVKEEVKKDFEILSFRANKKIGMIPEYTILEKEKDEVFRNHKACLLTISSPEDKLLNNSDYDIYSVKRLSDGEVFTIGDKTKEGTILAFDLPGSSIHMLRYKVDESKNGWRDILKAEKLKVLFTTEDGIDVFQNDKIFSVENKPYLINSILCLTASDKTKTLFPRRIFFSTERAAKNYIVCNYPCLNFYDVWNISNNKSSDNHYVIIDKRELKKLVKLKLF